MSSMGAATLRTFLKTALLPCGHTLYVWGGGWNEEDTGAGEDALTIGESPRWRSFFEENASGYDYTEHRFSHGDGLDCSGYIGWVLYNTMEYSRPEGYVMKSTSVAQTLSAMGLGSCITHGGTDICRPGDIVSMEGHVYISLGTCEDGSIVLLHSSPQAGVQISGTCVPGSSVEKGLAWAIADAAMQRHYPQCHALFGTKLCGVLYFTGQIFRWDYKSGPLSDPEGLSGLAPAELLKFLLQKP